jgi:hypothetical protein
MNLDTLVKIGSRPWRPTPVAHDVDIWDKSDFPTCGTFRLGDDLVIFTLITAVGARSLWAYVPIPADENALVTRASFDTETEFDEFVEGRFTGRETVFAAAENLVISAKSDGIRIPLDRHALVPAAATWYAQRAAAIAGRLEPPPVKPDETDPATVLRQAQGVLAESPV